MYKRQNLAAEGFWDRKTQSKAMCESNTNRHTYYIDVSWLKLW